MTIRSILSAIGLTVLVVPPLAMAQDGGEVPPGIGGVVWENARGGAVAERAPGNLVQSSTIRFQEVHANAIFRGLAGSGTKIDETEPEDDPQDRVIQAVTEAFFQQLTELIVLLGLIIGGDDTVVIIDGGDTPTVDPLGSGVSDLLGGEVAAPAG
jgi:hypothetical protein